MVQQNVSFFQYIKENPTTNNKSPFPIPIVICIVAGLALLDSVGCVVLIIAGFVCVRFGHQGLGLLLAITNLIAPDALPVVDEAAGLAVTLVPMYKNYQKMLKGEANIADMVLDVMDSSQQYQNGMGEYMNMDTKDVVRTISEEFAMQSNQNQPEQFSEGQAPEIEMSSQTNEITDALAQLYQLKQSGVISEQEFERKKAELLERI